MTITPEFQAILSKFSNNDKSLTALDLTDRNIGVEELGALSDSLRKNLNLESLSLAILTDDQETLIAVEDVLRMNLGLMNISIVTKDKGAITTDLIEASLKENRIANDVAEIFASYLKNPETKNPTFTTEEIDFILDSRHPENSVFCAIKLFHAIEKHGLSEVTIVPNDGFAEIKNFLDIAAKGAVAIEAFLLSEPSSLSPEDGEMQEDYLANLVKDPQFLIEQVEDWEQDAIAKSGIQFDEKTLAELDKMV